MNDAAMVATHSGPAHQPSLPAFPSDAPFPVEIAALPASTRTSFTRVDPSRPATSAGARGFPSDHDSDSDSHHDHDHDHDSEEFDDVRDAGAGVVEGVKETHGAEEMREREGAGAGVVPQAQAQALEECVPQTPQTSVTFLLVSGRRRTMVFEPETTVGRVKELVWNTWPNDWQDERPPAPSYLRILHLGKILQDDDTLAHLGFEAHTPPAPAAGTIVHLSVRAGPPPADDGWKKKRRKKAAAAEAGAGAGEVGAEGGCCGCVVS